MNRKTQKGINCCIFTSRDDFHTLRTVVCKITDERDRVRRGDNRSPWIIISSMFSLGFCKAVYPHSLAVFAYVNTRVLRKRVYVCILFFFFFRKILQIIEFFVI